MSNTASRRPNRRVAVTLAKTDAVALANACFGHPEPLVAAAADRLRDAVLSARSCDKRRAERRGRSGGHPSRVHVALPKSQARALVAALHPAPFTRLGYAVAAVARRERKVSAADRAARGEQPAP